MVCKGSKAAANRINSRASNSIAYRPELINEGILVDKSEYFEFTDDYIFSNSSTAAITIMGRNANGLTKWKSKEGKTVKDFGRNEKATKP